MAISGLYVISRWVRRLFTVTSQDKFLKLWKIYGKWEEMVPTRGYIFRSDRSQFGPVATSFLLVFLFFRMKRQLDHCCLDFHATGGWSGPVVVFFVVLNWTLNLYSSLIVIGSYSMNSGGHSWTSTSSMPMSMGLSLTCCDEITHCFYPRILMYSADYPEK